MLSQVLAVVERLRQLLMLGDGIAEVVASRQLCDHEHDVSFHWRTGRDEQTWAGPHNRFRP